VERQAKELGLECPLLKTNGLQTSTWLLHGPGFLVLLASARK
jgi:hypothetical protein